MTTSELLTRLEENVLALTASPATPPSDPAAPRGLQGSDPEAGFAGNTTGSPKIMIVDDEPVNIKIVQKFLKSEEYENFVTTTEPAKAMDLLLEERPDVLLLDIMMPRISGLDILEAARAREELSGLPIIILTAATDQDTKINALELGATDFLGKPVKLAELVTRVRNTLAVKAHQDQLKNYAKELEERVTARTHELATAQLELIHCLALAAEYRDNDTGRHVVRVGRYAGIIARQLNLDPRFAQLIEHAAPLHDVGKIGIPDAILLKPGKLEPEEFEFMKRHSGFGKRIFERMPNEERSALHSHAETGAKIMSVSGSPILKVAAKIALTHHEKWDGSGYPLGLAGEDIPIEGRVTAVADVFDALSTKRPYKDPFPLAKCFAILEEGRGAHFDPEVLDAFLESKEDIVRIQIEYADVD
jgi:cyclic di-GMP phosphodiesterase